MFATTFPSQMFVFKFQILFLVFSVVLLPTIYSKGLRCKGSYNEVNENSNVSLQSGSGNLRRMTSDQALSVTGRNDAPHMHHDPKLCANATLFGRAHKGGWVVCESYLKQKPSAARQCIVYSYGLGADWSFDNAAEEFGCEVHGFDPTGLLWRQGMHGKDYSGIDYAMQYPSDKKRFHNWGLGVLPIARYPPGTVPQSWPGLGDPQLSKSNTEEWELRSIEQTMIDLKHYNSSNVISILKIDTEGAEWDALTAFFNSKSITDKLLKGKVQQILLELHWDPDSRALNKRHALLLNKIQSYGFHPWYVNRHEGSECCLDVSYIWKPVEKLKNKLKNIHI